MRLSHHRSEFLGALLTCQSGQEVGARSQDELLGGRGWVGEGGGVCLLCFFLEKKKHSILNRNGMVRERSGRHYCHYTGGGIS